MRRFVHLSLDCLLLWFVLHLIIPILLFTSMTAFKLLPFFLLWFLFPLQLEIEGMFWSTYVIPNIPSVLGCISYVLFPPLLLPCFPTPLTSGLVMWLAFPMECEWTLYISYLSIGFKCACVVDSVSRLTLTFHMRTVCTRSTCGLKQSSRTIELQMAYRWHIGRSSIGCCCYKPLRLGGYLLCSTIQWNMKNTIIPKSTMVSF